VWDIWRKTKMSDNHPFAIADDVDDLKLREQQPDLGLPDRKLDLAPDKEVHKQIKQEKAAGTDGNREIFSPLYDVGTNKVADMGDMSNKSGIPLDNEVAGDRAKSALWVSEVKSFCYNASIVGLPYIVYPTSSTFKRLMWSLLLLAGFVFTAFQVRDRIISFLSRPTNVKVYFKYVDSMRFPTVTFCNENRYTLSAAEYLGE
jgi:hypothetical protein